MRTPRQVHRQVRDSEKAPARLREDDFQVKGTAAKEQDRQRVEASSSSRVPDEDEPMRAHQLGCLTKEHNRCEVEEFTDMRSSASGGSQWVWCGFLIEEIKM